MDISTIFSSPPAIAAGLSIIAVVMLIADMFSSSRKRIDERVSEQQRKLVREQVSKSRLFKEWKAGGASSGEEFNPNFQQKLELYLEQSGLRLTIADVCRRSVLFATVAGVLPALYCHYSITFGAMLAGAVIPWVHVVVAHRKRMRKLSEQLPEVFDFMRRSVQAGQTIQNALQIVAKQTSSPVSDELTYCCEQQNLGLPYELTLRDMAQRTGVVEFQLFSVALLMQRQAGGDPSEVLENLAELSRKRGKLAMKIRAITGEGRMQANVLSLMPFGAFFGIYLLDRQYASILLNYPYLLVGLTVAIATGILWIRKIINFEY